MNRRWSHVTERARDGASGDDREPHQLGTGRSTRIWLGSSAGCHVLCSDFPYRAVPRSYADMPALDNEHGPCAQRHVIDLQAYRNLRMRAIL
jgi:hypothetical protein